MNEQHINLMIFAGVLAAVGLGGLAVGTLIGPKKKGFHKETPYECGSPLLQATRSKFDVRFFMLAMLFILFDIETVLLLPYLIQYDQFGEDNVPMLIVAGIFFLGLVESLAYAWKKGALDWNRKISKMPQHEEAEEAAHSH